ncbi:Peptidoglycan/LPS O-acetylase OafA/YrhL, contains acyltransferase and SGNH-hydrolase domains [Bradyrhizobium erythrophlei]|jgi:peptidoglycan/LPS O-acetylase OafA/YrhL|nr:Peptidoglycan/LPS O-acetylase OafA/YrhL, contains acyltransferase and SGNH-hydrolase domains [Bradyrhizobium erythrophlei]
MERAATVLKATGKPANGDAFRLDINALRAVSVAAVVGYHFQIPGFAGGFVGVDIFLVITGYLMTGKVLNDLALGRFSFITFLLMRLRRIYPALAVMIASTIVVGWFVTLPNEYLKHLLQALSALIFQSNFAFNSDNGYFAMAAQTKPLLHTWSLSLEGQFYFWMPLVVPLVWRLASRSKVSAVMTTFQVVAALSLAWCLWESQNDATGSSFFALPARAWEPLAGGLIAIAELQRRSESPAKDPAKNPAKASWLETQMIAVLGWTLVAGCILSPFPESRWPGVLTILPILGAAMIVGARQGAGAGGLLAISSIQRIGDWSYSIYLWHWPIWVFALSWLSLRGYGVGATQKTLMVLASLGLGAISYRFVEQPVRLRRDFWTPRRLLLSSSAAFALSIGFVALAFLNRGFPNRLPGYMLPAELARRTSTPRDECFRDSNSTKKAAETYCSFGSAEVAGRPSTILWGDSYANQYLEPISAAALASGIHGLIATQNGCRAFLDDPAGNSGDQPSCRKFNRNTLDFVLGRTEPSIVVLASNWADGLDVSALVEKLLASGKTVILIMPLLHFGFDLPQRWIENQVRAGRAIDEWKVKADPVLTMSSLRDAMVQIVQKHWDNPRLVTVDPLSVICEQGDCYLVRNGQANFRDTAHISNLNAMQFRGVFDAAFRSALRVGPDAGKKAD